jgi:hypothetical protein
MAMTGRKQGRGRPAVRAAGPSAFEDVEARAARLGITRDRVLEEYGRIAFANLHHILEWGDQGMQFKPDGQRREDDMAAIAEIVEGASSGKPYRLKLFDKKAALDAIARYLGMVAASEPAPQEDEPTEHDSEAARERFIHEVDRLAAEAAPGSGDPQHER